MDPVVVFGDESVNWDAVSNLLAEFESKDIAPNYKNPGGLRRINQNTTIRNLAHLKSPKKECWRELQCQIMLSRLLYLKSSYGASDPRDQVFALLGLPETEEDHWS